MTKLQQRLMDALQAHEEAGKETWAKVVEATNQLASAIESGDEVYDAGFPPELERQMDSMANDTAWVYGKLEWAYPERKRNTALRIRKAMGYTG